SVSHSSSTVYSPLSLHDALPIFWNVFETPRRESLAVLSSASAGAMWPPWALRDVVSVIGAAPRDGYPPQESDDDLDDGASDANGHHSGNHNRYVAIFLPLDDQETDPLSTTDHLCRYHRHPPVAHGHTYAGEDRGKSEGRQNTSDELERSSAQVDCRLG